MNILQRSGWLLLIGVALLSGCRSYGPVGTADFDPTYSRTLEQDEQLLFASSGVLMAGTYMEGEEELYQEYSGMLLLTSERMMFALWNNKQQRYVPSIWTAYSDIARVKKHNNILLQYIAIVATDGSKFTYMLGSKSVEKAHAVLMERIGKNHKVPMPG